MSDNSLKTIENATRLDDTKPVYTEAEMYNAVAYAMANAYWQTRPTTALVLATLSAARGTVPQEDYSETPKEIIAADAVKADLAACIEEVVALTGIPEGRTLDLSIEEAVALTGIPEGKLGA